MEEKNLTCIGCPMGCFLTVKIKDGEVQSVEGNSCKRGAVYGRKEVTNPTRIVTTTVRVLNGTEKVVSVKTKEDIQKSRILDCIRELKEVTVTAPVEIGDVVLHDVAGTGVDIVATKNISVSIDITGSNDYHENSMFFCRHLLRIRQIFTEKDTGGTQRRIEIS